MRIVLRVLCHPLLYLRRAVSLWSLRPRRIAMRLLAYDSHIFLANSGSIRQNTRESRIAQIVMAYHVIEKGLTMPHKRLGFGRDAILELISLIERYEIDFADDDAMVLHAIGVVKEYQDLHRREKFDFQLDVALWKRVEDFCARYGDVPCARQMVVTREKFFSEVKSSFPEFAASRHTCRHYVGTLSIEMVRQAVKLAMTAPSACNRQHTRVHCVSNHRLRDDIYSIQNGNRGFGKNADKLLVVTTDLNDLRWNEERHDIYTNGGMFLMNLCYALHYYKVAHCVLNWSVNPESDKAIASLLGIGENERVVALVCCGPMPDVAEIAASPRKRLEDIFTEHS